MLDNNLIPIIRNEDHVKPTLGLHQKSYGSTAACETNSPCKEYSLQLRLKVPL